MYDGEIEVRHVTAKNNIEAFQMADAFRPEVRQMFAMPCPVVN